MGVERAVHGVDGAGQGDDLKIAAELVCIVPLLLHLVHAHCKIIGRAQGGDTGQRDVLPARKLLHLLKDLLASVDPRHDFIVKSSVFHRKALLAFRFSLWYFHNSTWTWLSVKMRLKILRILCT